MVDVLTWETDARCPYKWDRHHDPAVCSWCHPIEEPTDD